MRLLALLLLAVTTHSSPMSVWPRVAKDKWETVTCSDPKITDAKALANERWQAADVATSWTAALTSWQQYEPGNGQTHLKFPAFISDFYGGPEGWDCQNPVNTPCSTTVKCADTTHPAGFLLLNSFAALHDVYQKYHESLQDAQLSIVSAMGDFTDAFAPKLTASDDSTMFKVILDVIAVGIGVASAGLWNIVVKDAAIFSSNNHGTAKDSINSAISGSFAVNKDTTKAAKDSASVQNDLTSAMGALFDTWRQSQADYLSMLFSGSKSAIGMLDSLLHDGMMNMVPIDINLSGMVDVVENIMFGQLIPIGWKVSPAGFAPFVLKTGDVCTPTLPESLNNFMTQETHDQAGVCYNNNQFYVLTVGYYKDGVDVQVDTPGYPGTMPPFQLLAGGTKQVLDGKNWGGITLDDMVVSSYGGYLENGNRNGYKISEATNADSIMWAGGVQTAGFFTLPVCTSLWNTLINIASTPRTDEFWPCGVVNERSYG